MAVVYWIHLEQHSDITKEGYVGITTQPPTDRFKEHKADSKRGRTILNRALLKHSGEVHFDVLVEGSAEYCLIVENKLRPDDRIGWNTVAGGGKPPVFRGHSPESRLKIGLASKRTAHSPAQIAHRKTLIGVKRPTQTRAMLDSHDYSSPWLCPRANINRHSWVQAADIFNVWKAEKDAGRKRGSIYLERIFGASKGTFTKIVKNFNHKHWNPSIDTEWVKWTSQIQLKEKELSI
jgi:hypothetical protein